MWLHAYAFHFNETKIVDIVHTQSNAHNPLKCQLAKLINVYSYAKYDLSQNHCSDVGLLTEIDLSTWLLWLKILEHCICNVFSLITIDLSWHKTNNRLDVLTWLINFFHMVPEPGSILKILFLKYVHILNSADLKIISVKFVQAFFCLGIACKRFSHCDLMMISDLN